LFDAVSQLQLFQHHRAGAERPQILGAVRGADSVTGKPGMKLSALKASLRRRLALGEAGIAGVELALAAPMLALLMVGGFDFGRAIYEQYRLTAAADAGIQYATASV